MALIFFSHPIDRASADLLPKIDEVLTYLGQHPSISVFKPADAWQARPPFDWRVQEMNNAVLTNCDCVLVLLPSDARTRGVPLELTVALERQIPVVLIADISADSLIEQYWAQHPGVVQFRLDEVHEAVARAVDLAQFGVAVRFAEANGVDLQGDAPLEARYTGDDGQLTQAHEGDAGFDLAYNGTKPLKIKAGERASIPTGVRVEMPEGYYSLIVGRSSSFSKRNLIVPLSVIDAGFRGELFAVCLNYGNTTQVIQPGERVAQLLPMQLTAPMIRWRKAPLSETARAEQGFGSSGL